MGFRKFISWFKSFFSDVPSFGDVDDIQFENEVLWDLPELNQPYSYSLEEKGTIDWNSEPLEPIEKEPKVQLTEQQIEENLQEIEKKYDVLPEEKLTQDSLILPIQGEEPVDQEEDIQPIALSEESADTDDKEVQEQIEQEATPEESEVEVSEEPKDEEKSKEEPKKKEEKPFDLLKLKFFQGKEEQEKASPRKDKDIEKELEDEAHEKLLEEQKALQEQGSSLTYNLKDFPLAEPELINRLCEAHSVFFNLLSKLQETHTPTDFVTAYHIQDRIAYLIDNQTLLYRTLTKKLIKYLDRINEKLKNYYDEITLKQEDLRRINAQISRFNEYDRKTQTRIDQAERETKLYQEDLDVYQEHLNAVSSIPKQDSEQETPLSNHDK